MVNRIELLEKKPHITTHCKEHAVQTADLALHISKLPEYKRKFSQQDRNLIEIAALTHDCGHPNKELFWSVTQWEQPYAFLNNFKEAKLDLNPVEEAIVQFIVLNHDATNRYFPEVMRRSGIDRSISAEIFGVPGLAPGVIIDWPNISSEVFSQIDRKKLIDMLQVVQEADARLGNIQRTFDFSVNRNIPIVSGDYGDIGMPMWQESALANILLAAKRALLDAYTAEGKEFAWKMFVDAREFCSQYIPQNHIGEILNEEDIQKLVWSKKTYNSRFSPSIRITQAFNLIGTQYILSAMEGNEDLGHNRLVSKLVDISSIDKSKIRNDQLSRHISNSFPYKNLLRIRDGLICNYAFDLLRETSGILRVMVESNLEKRNSTPKAEYTLIPPIIDNLSYTILNPNSRVWIDLAKDLKIPQIRVLTIS